LDILKNKEEKINSDKSVILYIKKSFNKLWSNKRFNNNDESDNKRLKYYLYSQRYKIKSC
jgi:hypothetical protein